MKEITEEKISVASLEKVLQEKVSELCDFLQTQGITLQLVKGSRGNRVVYAFRDTYFHKDIWESCDGLLLLTPCEVNTGPYDEMTLLVSRTAPNRFIDFDNSYSASICFSTGYIRTSHSSFWRKGEELLLGPGFKPEELDLKGEAYDVEILQKFVNQFLQFVDEFLLLSTTLVPKPEEEDE